MVKHVIVLGAGISGLSAAWRLSNYGIEVTVLESNESVGGLAQTLRDDFYSLDCGPHSFFSDDRQIVDITLRLFNNVLQPRVRRVRFYYRGNYLNYPLTPDNILLNMGLFSGMRATLSFIKGRLSAHNPDTRNSGGETVEDWATASFGRHLYQTFFKPYTEQFWKVPCSKLSSRAIPTHTRMSFANTLRLLLRKKVSSCGESLIEREMLPTYYPDGGFSEIAEHIAESIKQKNGNILLGCKVVDVNQPSSGMMRIHYVTNGQDRAIKADYVISTVPLPSLVKMLNPPTPPDVSAAADSLDYRPLIVLGMVTHKQNILNCSYMYLLDRPFNRIFEMNEFSPLTSPEGENILAVEIPCLNDSVLWNATKEELFDMCIGSLAEDGFLSPGDVKRLLLIKAPAAYPIYRIDYARHLNKVMNYLKTCESLATLGRCGEFMYMDIDQCMKRAFDFVDTRRGIFLSTAKSEPCAT